MRKLETHFDLDEWIGRSIRIRLLVPLSIFLGILPVALWIYFESTSADRLRTAVTSVQAELVQSVITSDSYLAQRQLNTLINGLSLQFAQIQVNSKPFAQAGEFTDSIFSFLSTDMTSPIAADWGDAVASLRLVTRPVTDLRILSFLFLCVSWLLLFFIHRMYRMSSREISSIIGEIRGLTEQLENADPIKGITLTTEFRPKSSESQSLFNAIVKYNTALEQVAEKDAEIEKSKALSMLATKVAHDIRSPLSAIRMIALADKEKFSDAKPLLTSAVSRLEGIAEDVLQTYKSKRHQESAPIFSHLLTAELQEVLNEIKTSYPSTQINCQFNEMGLINLKISKLNFQRMISNLCQNSIDSKANGIILTVEAILKAKEIEISIGDNGPGIPNELLLKLGKSEISFGKIGGTGIGLKSVYETVNGAGGSVKVDSEIGIGTKVTITLPLVGPTSKSAN
jgi:signal transduction histidine kinase